MELYVIRHGKTDWNKEYRFQGAHDIPLNEEGRQAARKLGEHLKDVHFDYVFSSPLSRAYETACIVIETPGSLRHSKGPIKTDPLLTEVSFGELEGLPFDQWMDTDEPRKYFFKVSVDSGIEVRIFKSSAQVWQDIAVLNAQMLFRGTQGTFHRLGNGKVGNRMEEISCFPLQPEFMQEPV